MTAYSIYRADPWTLFVEQFDEFVNNWVTCQRHVDPYPLASRLEQDALALRKVGKLSAPPTGAPDMAATVRQVRGVATTDDAVVALAEFLQGGLDRGLAPNSIAAYSEQWAARLQTEYH